MPRYPVYIISKGRYTKTTALTAQWFMKDGVPFTIAVEPQELEEYKKIVPEENIFVLPFSNLGQGSIPARNACWEHSIEQGHERHWLFDDNIRSMKRWYKGKRITCNANPGFEAIEDFVDRYENVAIAGMNYSMFCPGAFMHKVPFRLNVHVYSNLLIKNDIPQRWRGRYNEDTDLCLQVLSAGQCTLLFNIFMIEKMRTMTMKGGNSDELYQDDGRLKMAKSLERQWPKAVTVDRRFKRPQHVVDNGWRKFDTPLKRRKDIDWDAIKKAGTNDYGMELKAVGEVKSKDLRGLLDE